ncbi:MAG: DNA replication/repair protein RecF [Anaerolineae bacterium]
MRLKRLTLVNFRNYSRLEIAFDRPLIVLQGDNAQGKSNLLEAIYMLATSKSPRTNSDRDLLNWFAESDVQPYARIDAEIERAERTERIEITFLKTNGGANGSAFRKQIRINGVNRRALDLLGHLNVVLFVPQDVELVDGSPSVRRRYLDIMLCQINPRYCRVLSEYSHAVVQRSHLLRRLRERPGDPAQLAYWDEMLVTRGAEVMAWRRRTILALDQLAGTIHRELTNGGELLRLKYQPSLLIPEALQPPLSPELAAPQDEVAQMQAAFAERLARLRPAELHQGACLVGPHRDDLRFVVNGRDLQTYGSRGQQRTAALSLKMAETRLMHAETGEHPVLLLDDVLSELDTKRRECLLEAVNGVEQAILTTTDLSLFSAEFLARADALGVTQGRIQRLAPGGGADG